MVYEGAALFAFQLVWQQKRVYWPCSLSRKNIWRTIERVVATFNFNPRTTVISLDWFKEQNLRRKPWLLPSSSWWVPEIPDNSRMFRSSSRTVFGHEFKLRRGTLWRSWESVNWLNNVHILHHDHQSGTAREALKLSIKMLVEALAEFQVG